MGTHWRELKVWQKAHEIVLEIYRVSTKFPKEERYGLVDQLKRAAYSVPANLVEGQNRNSTKEYLNFLYISRGSLEELRYFLLLSKDLSFLDDVTYNRLEDECRQISQMINAMISSLRKK